MGKISKSMYEAYNAEQEQNRCVVADLDKAAKARRGRRGNDLRFTTGDTIEFAVLEDTGKLDIREVTIESNNGTSNSYYVCTVIKNGVKPITLWEVALDGEFEIYTETESGHVVPTGEIARCVDPVKSDAQYILDFFKDHEGFKLECVTSEIVFEKEYGQDKLRPRRRNVWKILVDPRKKNNNQDSNKKNESEDL